MKTRETGRSSRPARALKPRATLSEISRDSIYPLDVFMTHSGLSQAALREARRNGLKVRRIGRRSFIVGEDFLKYVMENGKLVEAFADEDEARHKKNRDGNDNHRGHV